jgi:uncharacterized repeat protein (TIGR03803 family)
LVRDENGNLYGTTEYGGNLSQGIGCGTVFQVTAAGVEKVLWTFSCTGTDQGYPNGTLVQDKKGNLYGTTQGSGRGLGNVFGTVFGVSLSGKERTLYSFQANGVDGISPAAGLITDGKGNFYGTCSEGGTSSGGTVFEISPTN